MALVSSVLQRMLSNGQILLGRYQKLLIGGGLICILVNHYYVQTLPETTKGPLLLVDRLFDLTLAGVVILLSAGWGLRMLRAISPTSATPHERFVIGFALGSGALAYVVFGIGLLGLLWPPVAALLLLASAILLRKELGEAAALVGRGLASLCGSARCLRRKSWAGLIAFTATALAFVSLVQALTPPTAVDEIGYHLALPTLYVQAHHIYYLPMHHGDGRPFTLEMLYTLGLLFGSDIFARLLHFSFAIATGVLAYDLGKRYESATAGWLSLVVLLSVPLTVPLAGWAYADFGLAFFELLAVAVGLRWLEDGDRRWLVIAGAAIGLAMGTKYHGLHLFAVFPFLLAIGWLPGRRGKFTSLAIDLACTAAIAVLVASPWFLRNWVWTGQLFHYSFAGSGGELNLAAEVGRVVRPAWSNVRNFLLLPLDVFIHSTRYTGHVPTAFSALFAFLPLVVFTGLRWQLRHVLLTAGLLFILWAGRQGETRYYLPGSVLLSIVTGAILSRLIGSITGLRLARHALPLAVLLVTAASLLDQAEDAFVYRRIGGGPISVASPIRFILGWQSRDEYVKLHHPEYEAVSYANANLPAGSTVLFLRSWAGGHYSRLSYIPDNIASPSWLVPTPRGFTYPRLDRASGWERMSVGVAPTMEEALSESRCLGVTHLFLSKIVLQGKAVPGATQRAQAVLPDQIEAISRLYEDGGLRLLYSDRYAAILEIMIPPATCQEPEARVLRESQR